MNRSHRPLFIMLGSASLVVLAAQSREARACGGCFHEPPQPNPPPNEVDTVVTDHRMAFALSTRQSVLWDQIRYVGSPAAFAWVLPVLPGAQVELSNDAWLAALDASTATVIVPPPLPSCAPPPSTGGGGNYGGGAYDQPSGGSGGCGCVFPGSDSSENAGFAASSGGSGGGEADGSVAAIDAGVAPPPPVVVTTQETVGPYEVVVLHSSMGQALDAWLTANGFVVPQGITPILQSYIVQHMDFVAMKLAPGSNVRAMQPVRIIEPGADPTLPLRMISAGTGAHVGLALWVISEGRYHPQNFPDVAIDFSSLSWDVNLSESSYSQLQARALATQGGRGWLTQFAGPAVLTGQGSNGLTPGLLDSYQQACTPQMPPNPCAGGAAEAGATQDAGDAANEEASVEAGDAAPEATLGDADTEAGDDAAATPFDAGCVPPTPTVCDDPDVAFSGLQIGDIWITRLVAELPASALATDLVLEATAQSQVSNVHQATAWVDGDPCTLRQAQFLRAGSNGSGGGARSQSCALGPMQDSGASSGALACGVALALAWAKRRRRSVPTTAT